jgi:DNA-binding NtrC family response regulator
MHNVLVVDDEPKIRENICEILELKGFTATEAPGGREAVEYFARKRPTVVLLDLNMPGMDGFETLRQLRQIDPTVPVIIVTAYSDIPSAVNAVKSGAYDFLPKPPDFDYLILTLNRAIEKFILERRIVELDEALNKSLESTLGHSNAIKKIIKQLPGIAVSDFTVLIQGETGTGKTYLANVIHSMSKRAGNPFIKVSIGSLQDTIVESEMFGYEKGAFTGADRTKKGYFEAAHKGTIFIDDLDNVSSLVQGKLLCIVEEKQVLRMGSTSPVPLDTRIIGATNANLMKGVAEGRFREDLYFRMSEVVLQLPPLRDRVEDIPFFGRIFFERACAELNFPGCRLSDEVIEKLKQYSWPGNLRQLKNVMKRAALLANEKTISPEEIDFLAGPLAGQGNNSYGETTCMTIRDAEKKAICQALAHTKGQKLKAASILQIDYKTLVRKMQEYSIPEFTS